jgi:hypothetical protein
MGWDNGGERSSSSLFQGESGGGNSPLESGLTGGRFLGAVPFNFTFCECRGGVGEARAHLPPRSRQSGLELEVKARGEGTGGEEWVVVLLVVGGLVVVVVVVVVVCCVGGELMSVSGGSEEGVEGTVGGVEGMAGGVVVVGKRQ